jgi:hypothetical protein
MAWGNESEQAVIESVLRLLEEASSEFDQLVAATDPTDLLDAIGSLDKPDLRRLVLARVLMERQRRAG